MTKKSCKNCFFIPQAIFPIMRYKQTKSHFCDELIIFCTSNKRNQRFLFCAQNDFYSNLFCL